MLLALHDFFYLYKFRRKKRTIWRLSQGKNNHVRITFDLYNFAFLKG